MIPESLALHPARHQPTASLPIELLTWESRPDYSSPAIPGHPVMGMTPPVRRRACVLGGCESGPMIRSAVARWPTAGRYGLQVKMMSHATKMHQYEA